MRIALTGATGFLGAPLVARLIEDGHDLVLFTRRTANIVLPRTQCVTWSPADLDTAVRVIDRTDAVINLAGEPMDGRRWSPDQKARIRESRLQVTHAIAHAIGAAARPPALLISASAVGYYGPHGDEVITEAAPAGSDFVASLCVQWEAEAQAAPAGTRVVLLRSGLVIEKDGGALARMLLPFRLGAGGPLGSGRQYWSWIHRSDWIDLVRWTLTHPALIGPVNATAPGPVTNADFSRALGRALHRPAILPAPAFALRLLFGEMADAMLLTGQRVVPEAAVRHGFAFRYPDLPSALRSILGRV